MTSTLTREHKPKASMPDGDPRALTSASLGMASRPSGSGPINRNTTRIAVGVTVLVVSVLATLTLYSSAGDRQTVIAVRRDVGAGQTIVADDLKEVSISVDTSVSTISASAADRAVGKVAMVPLTKGSLLASGQVDDAPELAVGEALVGAILKAGQYPTGLQSGSTVRIIEVPPADASGLSEPVSHGSGRVADIQESSNDGTTVVVSLVVVDNTAEAVASAGAGGRLSLVVQAAP
jgi:hypothetical protein